MGRPLKIKKVSPGSSISGSSVTVDAGFPNFDSLDPTTAVIPAGMTGTEYLGVVGGETLNGVPTVTNPIVQVTANLPGGEGSCFIVTQKGNAKYLVAGVDSVNAGGVTPGFSYVITALGDTNWAAVGAGINAQVGQVFTALTAGSGTGTASDCDQAILVSFADNDTPSINVGEMYIQFTPDGGTTTCFASKLTNKYIWNGVDVDGNIVAGTKYAVNFFADGTTTAGSGAEAATWTNTTGNYDLAIVDNFTA